jgi:hypothetical protein
MTRVSLLCAAAAVVVLQGCAIDPRLTQRGDGMFAQVRNGMTRDEVRAITGPPDNTMPFPATRTDSWGFYGWDTWGYYCEYSVTFGADGRVVSKFSRRLNDGPDRG